ncbi:MAG: MFS transporter [Methanobrevibacter sp.]|uniref:MFS transporter n=1 Tax=uncultured Methanobrevibacter sp. TaxID=253161 RepID=UPI0025FDE765|nr:MFS transporter [uncultured Methanobrevibacter sp.]MEE1129516.1 MFS transporter [Methanobrevibacter sp.]
MNKTDKGDSWLPLIVIALASFIIALDATFMNVSISQVVADLNTDVSTIQMTMSFYTLITAAFMLLSAKLQDIVGKKKLFLIGTALYGVGTFTAAISSSDLMLFIGWAAIEGVAGALMLPATVSLVSGSYYGEKRTVALAIVGVMGAVAAAVGPLFGGIMTTFFSWRYGFAIELVVVFVILIFRNKIPNFEPTESRSDLDISGAIISLIGLVLLVLGILSLSKDFTTSIGVIVVALIILAIFAYFEIRRKRNGQVPLLDMDLFKDRNLRTGTVILLLSYLSMGGALFAVSLYLQSVLQLNAFDTGLTTLPMTIGLLIFAILAPSLTGKLSHKIVMAIGCIMAIAGCLILSYQFRLDTTTLTLMPGLFVLGSGLGFLMALCTDISLSNIPAESQNNASGVNSTGTSLGESMGTAIIGIILILGVMGGVSHAVDVYAPNYSGNETFHLQVIDQFQKVGNINDLKSDHTVVDIVNIIIQDAMAFVMQITAIIMGIVFLLTLRLQNANIKKQ